MYKKSSTNPFTPTLRLSFWLSLWSLLCAPQLLVAADEYTFQQELTARADGQGKPNGLFGRAVAIDGDLAVAADVSTLTSPALIRTFRRSGVSWTYLANQDIVVRGDVNGLDFDDGSVVIASSTSTGESLRIHRRNVNDNGWDRELSISPDASTSFFDAAIAGNIAVFGETSFNNGAGRIWIFRRTGTSWGSPQLLTPAVTQSGARFGLSVAIVAGAIVVGAPREDVLTTTAVLVADAGAAYVFELTGNTWAQVIRITQPNNQIATNENFAQIVAISGANAATPDRLLVGVRSNETTGALGRVWRYARTGGIWTRLASSIAPPGGALSSDSFGCAMRMDGDWAVIGVCGKDTSANNGGAILLANFSSDFASTSSLTLRTDPLAAANDGLGFAVDIDRIGPTVVVGNLSADLYGNANQGVVLIGRGPTNPAPLLERRIDIGQGLDDAQVGSVASDGNALLLGARGQSIGSQNFRGAVYSFDRVNGSYALTAQLLAPDGMAFDQFGWQVVLSGDIALVSAPFKSIAGIVAGAVYAYRRNAGSWTFEALLQSPAPSINGSFGESIALSGNTALVGEKANASHFFVRAANGTWALTQTLAHRGHRAQLQGDLAVLADYNGGANNLGKVTTYARVAGAWQATGEQFGATAEQYFGHGLSLVGDSLAVSSGGIAKPTQIFRRSGENWLPEASIQPLDSTALTYCVRPAIRTTRLALGCFEGTGTRAGAIYLFEKQGNSWVQNQKITLPNPRQDDFTGANDVTFDPRGELLFGVIARDLGFQRQGAVYRYAELLRDGFE